MKYIIDIEDTPRGGLYKAKNFRSLVFDENGLRRLEPYQTEVKFAVGDEVRGNSGRRYVVISVYPSTVKVIDGDGCDYLFRKDAMEKTGRYYDSVADTLKELRGE